MALSTTESEYIALTEAIKEVVVEGFDSRDWGITRVVIGSL